MKFYIGEKEIEFDEITKQIKFDDKVLNPTIRTYGNMKKMYIEEEDRDENEGLYFMFRGVYLNEKDKALFEDNGMRYDITVIIPELIGEEFNKTYGHYHPEKGDGTRYEEIYEVLSGTAIYLQQNDSEVKFTDAFTGDKIIMNKGFGHITINPSDEDILVMANIVEGSFDSEYEEYEEFKGGNYYYTTSGFEKNTNYKNSLRITESEDLFEGGDMYDQFLNNPEKFNFLH